MVAEGGRDGRRAKPSAAAGGPEWQALLTEHIAAGGDAAAFWSFNPKTFAAWRAGTRRLLERQHNERMVLAFYSAMLPHMKKPPKLKDLLVGLDASPKPKRTGWQAQLSIARQWDAVVNGRR